MIKKILIANRGEIACRVIKTAKKMGIKTVAVYSDIDKNALHVRMADEAVHIGKAPAAESYLIADKILKACKETGADAVHPGYGFLSENADFCQQLKKENIIFIGPDVEAIVSMGDKMASKKLAAEAGVSTVPGHDKLIKDADDAVKVGGQIGYPIMIKASAGGGGKGMRVAYDAKECKEGFERAKNEAASSFGDDRILIEKFIEQPRHIEIQVIADKQGNCLYLAERECSIQRRHQKVIEEAPSPFLDEATRKAMGEQAVALAKAVNYHSAGTVEFIVDGNRNFYFLEMNTRLQVEHPVTEMVTGLDLVELMINVAAGEKIPLQQSDVKINGWAMETRIYAEDPSRGFLPSTGRLSSYIPPQENKNVRVDTGFVEGSEVSIFYDPMIAKLITHGKDRKESIALMGQALDAFYIRGIRQNINFLGSLIRHDRFVKGNLTTNFIAEEYPDGLNLDSVENQYPEYSIMIAAIMQNTHRQRASYISGRFQEFKPISEWVGILEGKKYQVHVQQKGNVFYVNLEGKIHKIETDWTLGQPLLHAMIDGKSATFQTERHNLIFHITHAGYESEVLMLSEYAAKLHEYMPEKQVADTGKQLVSPMPGLMIQIDVTEGQDVKAGEALCVIEAMKMENILVAERDAKVIKILAGQNESVAVDQPLIEFE